MIRDTEHHTEAHRQHPAIEILEFLLTKAAISFPESAAEVARLRTRLHDNGPEPAPAEPAPPPPPPAPPPPQAPPDDPLHAQQHSGQHSGQHPPPAEDDDDEKLKTSRRFKR